MPEDHRFYRDNGLYDYPQTQVGHRIFNAMLYTLRRIPFLEKKLVKVVRERHTRSLKSAIAAA